MTETKPDDFQVAMGALRSLLRNQDPTVARAAYESIRCFGRAMGVLEDPPPKRITDADVDAARRVANGLLATITGLCRLLDSDHPRIRRDAVRLVVERFDNAAYRSLRRAVEMQTTNAPAAAQGE